MNARPHRTVQERRTPHCTMSFVRRVTSRVFGGLWVVLAVSIGLIPGVWLASDASEATAKPSACGKTSALQIGRDGRRHVRIGPMSIHGFVARSEARLASARGQFRFTIALNAPPRAPITLRGRDCRSSQQMRFRAFGGQGPFSIPSRMPRPTATTAILRSPNRWYAVFGFVSRSGKWRLDAWQNNEPVGSAVIAVRASDATS
jgi:hypothetical protein